MTCNLVDLDAQDVIITTFPSSAKTSVVTTVLTHVSSSRISIACNILPGSSAVSYPTRNCCQEVDASMSTMQILSRATKGKVIPD